MNLEPPTVRPDHSVLECAVPLLMPNALRMAQLLPVVDASEHFFAFVTPFDLIKGSA